MEQNFKITRANIEINKSNIGNLHFQTKIAKSFLNIPLLRKMHLHYQDS